MPDTMQSDTAKRTLKDKVKDHAKDAGKTAFWVGVIQLAVEVVKLFAHH